MRTGFLLFLFSVFSNLDLFPQIQRLTSDPELTGASVSAVLADFVTGEQLDVYDEDRRLCPASVWKVATATAAIDLLGAEFRYRTNLAYFGEIKDSVLYGDLLIIGSGDPSLGSRHFSNGFEEILEVWTQAVIRAGIDSITGSIIGNSSYLKGDGLPRTRAWEDMGNYYGTAISGLNFNDNTYFLTFKTEADPGLKAKVISVYPEVPGLEFESEVTGSTVQADRAFIFGSPLSERRVVRGTLPAGRDRFTIKGSLPDPALFTAYHLFDKLKSVGVNAGSFRSETSEVIQPVLLKTIHTVESPPLAELVDHTLKESDNLFAESLLIQLGSLNGNSSLEGGLAALHQYYAPICETEYPFFAYDGSGLSRYTAISAAQIAKILLAARRNEVLRKSVLDALPEAGREGTMKWFGLQTNLAGNLRAKSGSMDKVKCYAGYFTTYTGRELVFVILVNNFEGAGVDIRKKIEDWLIRAYSQY